MRYTRQPAASPQAATDEIKRHGYRYLLVDSGDIGADDYYRNAGIWGLTLVGQVSGGRLFRTRPAGLPGCGCPASAW